MDLRAALEALRIGHEKWLALGQCVEVMIDQESVFLDCELANGDLVRARLMPLWGGNGWGIYQPVMAGLLFLIAFPEGDMDDSPIAIGPIHNEDDRVPSEAIDDNASFWLVMKPGQNVRIKVSDGGQVKIEGGDVSVEQSLSVSGHIQTQGAVDAKAGFKVASVPGATGIVTPNFTKIVVKNGIIVEIA